MSVTIQSIKNKIADFISRTGFFAIAKEEFFGLFRDITDKLSEVNDNVNSVAKSLIWQSPVVNIVSVLPTTGLTIGQRYILSTTKKIHTATSTTAFDAGVSPEAGWALMNTAAGYVYSYNGNDWKSTGLKAFPEDVTTTADLSSRLIILPGKNLLDGTKIQIKKGIVSNGAIVSNDSWASYAITEKLFFNGKSTMVSNCMASAASGFRHNIYDASGNCLSTQSEANGTITNVTGGVYAIMTINVNSSSGFQQIELGTSVSTYEPYNAAGGYVGNRTNTTLIARAIGTPGVDCDFAGVTAIQQAINSITDASISKRYTVKCYGNFTTSNPNDYVYSSLYNQHAFIVMKNYIDLDGINKDSCIVRADLSQILSDVQASKSSFVKSDYGIYQTILANANSNIQNMTVITRNGRYPLHIDGSEQACRDYVSNHSNLVLIHEGKYVDAVGTIGGTASGFGLSSGQKLNFVNTIFKTAGNAAALYCHNNKDYADGAEFSIIDCVATNDVKTISNGFYVNFLGSDVSSRFIVKGTKIDGWLTMQDGWKSVKTLKADHNEIDIIMPGNNPLPIYPNTIGLALRIRSKSTSTPSTVRFDTTCDAYPLIIGDLSLASSSENNYLRTEISGYQYKDGGNGLRGEAIGYWDVGEYLIQGQFRTPIGKRLGDCSGINKTLTVVIDGITYSIVFNKNYNGTAPSVLPAYSNAQILAEITAVIGAVADVDLYKLTDDYYPKFSGLCIRLNNDTTAVEAGMGVIFTGDSTIRRALNTDGYIDGIALDNAVVGGKLRMITSGSIAQYYGFRHVLKEVAPQAGLPITTRWGISATSPGYFDRSVSPKLLKKGIDNSVIII